MKKIILRLWHFITQLFTTKQTRNKQYFADADEKLTKQLLKRNLLDSELRKAIQTYISKKAHTAHNDHHRTLLVQKIYGKALAERKLKLTISQGIIKLKRIPTR